MPTARAATSAASARNGAGTRPASARPARSPSQKRKKAPDLGSAPGAKMPTQIKPMLATLVSEPFDRPGWLFEIKWDGYRAIAEVRKTRGAPLLQESTFLRRGLRADRPGVGSAPA